MSSSAFRPVTLVTTTTVSPGSMVSLPLGMTMRPQQLREKDDANFKLMSERIKSNQIHKLLKEEKEELADQVLTLKTQVDAQLQVVRKLEEKEHLLQSNIGTGEKELGQKETRILVSGDHHHLENKLPT